MDRVISRNVAQLRRLYDQVENNVRALSTVCIRAEYFGPFLIPIVLEKLPNVIRLQISRKLGKENWDMQAFIQCINEEISARENIQYLKNKKDEDKRNFTASALATASGISKKQCDKNHYSD